MPNLKTYSLPQICKLYGEAMRTIPGYRSIDPTYEPRALLNREKTKDNIVLAVNDCMLFDGKQKKKTKKMEEFIKIKTGRTARKDAVACSIILTMPRDYVGDVRTFFDAGVEALCITCGIKKEDILYAVVHMDEVQKHLHFCFLPISYVRGYDEKKREWEDRVRQAKANGTKVPARPSDLKGEVNRKIEDDEVAVGCTCGRFGRGFLKMLNSNLEERMAEQGVICHLANGAGGKFDPQRMNKAQREESVRLYDAIEEMKIELSEKEEKIASMRTVIKQLADELARITKEVAAFIPNLIAEFMKKWKEARAVHEKFKVEEGFQKKVQSEAESLYSHLSGFSNQTQELLKEEEIVSGISMDKFVRTPQRVEFAKKQIRKAAEKIGRLAEWESNPLLMELALKDWFDEEKHRKQIETMSELEASLYMEATVRAARALDTVPFDEVEEELEIL